MTMSVVMLVWMKVEVVMRVVMLVTDAAIAWEEGLISIWEEEFISIAIGRAILIVMTMSVVMLV